MLFLDRFLVRSGVTAFVLFEFFIASHVTTACQNVPGSTIPSRRTYQLIEGSLHQLDPFFMNTKYLGEQGNEKWNVCNGEFSLQRNIDRPGRHAFYVPELTSLER